MSYDFRLPQFSGNDREQIAQIKSYLYQFIPKLEWALNTIEGSGASNYVAPTTVKNVVSSPSYASLNVGEDWLSLGLSANVSESESNAGRCGGTGCYYRVCAEKKHIYVAFNCAFTYSGSALQINAAPIPLAYRPKRNVYAICVTDGRAVARILVTEEGNIIVDWIQIISSAETTTSSEVKWIDGYIDYWI